MFHSENGSIDLPLIDRVVRSVHVSASPRERDAEGDNSPTTNANTKLRLSFRVTTDLQDVPDGFASWAAAHDVTVLAEGNQSSLGVIGDLSNAGVRVPVRVSVTDIDPPDLMSLCEAWTEVNQGAGLVFSRGQEGPSGYPRDETAAAVLEVQRSHLIPLRRMHPQNDWLNRIELGQGLPWSCGMSTGQVSAFGPDGQIAQCPLHEQRPVRSAHVNASLEEAPLQTATALGVDNLPHCSDCQLRYICGGPCRAAAPGCLFERACIEDLLFEVARTASGQKH